MGEDAVFTISSVVRATASKMHTPPTGLLAYGWMPGPLPVEEPRDDAALRRALRDLGQGADDDPDTQFPLLDEVEEASLQRVALAPPAELAPAITPLVERIDTAPAGASSFSWSSKDAATRRLMLSIALVLGLFGFGLALDHFYFGREGHGALQQAFEAQVTRLQDAMAKRDFAAAERALAQIDGAQDGDPRVQAARQTLAEHERAQAQRREQLQDAARRASLELGFRPPAQPDAQPARPDDTVQIVGTMTPSPAGAAQPGACNAALIALALCSPTTASRGVHAP